MRSPPPVRGTARGLAVTILSANADTLRGLETYLRGAGVTVNGTRIVNRLVDMTPRTSTAVVLFPDDFAAHAIDTALAALRTARPDLLAVIVSSDAQRFRRTETRAGSPALVIPKPAWAWTILDAIRARLEAAPGAPNGSS